MAADLATTVRRLTSASRRAYGDATALVDWPERLDRASWCLSPELVSLYGTPIWDRLDDAQRRTLSFWEAVNFFSLNIHGERFLMQGLAARLYAPSLTDVAPYLHHFLDEENRHSVWFATFCLRYGGRIYPDRSVAFTGPDDDLLFFARAALFEELVDRFNVAMAADERLVPVARRINALHHADEARHLVFGRRIVADRFARPGVDPAVVRAHLTTFVNATWRALANPAAYRDAGLDDPAGCARLAWSHPTCAARRAALTRTAIRPFVEAGVLTDD